MDRESKLSNSVAIIFSHVFLIAELIRIRAKCKKFFIYMKFMALVVLSFLYLQNQFFESDISSNILTSKSELSSIMLKEFTTLIFH